MYACRCTYLLITLLHYMLHDLCRGVELRAQDLSGDPAKDSC